MIGIDEAGRGAWAGPLVVVGCCFQNEPGFVARLRDSKQLTKNRRVELCELIKAEALLHCTVIPVRDIDVFGLTTCLKRAMEEIAARLPADEQIIIDGPFNFLKDTAHHKRTQTLIKADTLIPEVMAASIVAKVTRDELMAEYGRQYPDYGFETHVGYGTRRHQEALREFGVSELHRRSYKPVAALLI